MSIKSVFTIGFLILSFQYLSAQDIVTTKKFTSKNKGKFFFSFAGNRENYTKSDIHFKGADYDFTLQNVVAKDKPKGWHIDYINPLRMTIPQTNLRLGYFISDHYSIAIAVDHMKYVMRQNQVVNSNGFYPNPGSYGELQPNNQLLLTEDFLTFEHTDGLNYVHTEVSRFDDFSNIFKIANTDKFQINLTEGIGAGILYPKTNAKLLGNERHDDYNIAGYGVSAKVGLNFTFFKYFFLQTELKGGYINMSNIRTTASATDKAEQEFFYLQRIIAFGGIFTI